MLGVWLRRLGHTHINCPFLGVDPLLKYFLLGVPVTLSIYVTGFAKTGLIAGVRNYSYCPFSSAK